MLSELVDLVRKKWWTRGYRRFYSSAAHRDNPFAMNAGDGGRFHALVEELSPLVGDGRNLRVLDLGAGNGRLGRALFGSSALLVLADFRVEAIEEGELGMPIAANMRMLPFRESSFDLVFTYGTLPHFGSEQLALRAIEDWAKLLRAGGKMYIGDIPDRRRIPRILATAVKNRRPLPYWFALLMQSFYSKRRLVRHLEANGFAVRVISQSPSRRFRDARFDIHATKIPPGQNRFTAGSA